jgi:hypothetical protein
MSTIEDKLKDVEGYLASIKRNPDDAAYEIEVGIPKSWVYKENDDFAIKVIQETDLGSLILISGKHDKIILDNLISFVAKIIETNEKLRLMEEEFEKQMKEAKENLEKQLIGFQEKLEKVKSQSFIDEEESKENAVDETPEETSEEDAVQLKDMGDDEELMEKIKQ